MLSREHRFVALFYGADGSALVEAPLTVDWEPAREWARWSAVRRSSSAAGFVPDAERLSPIWSSKLGEPYLGGFRIALELNGEELEVETPGTAYFEDAIERAVKELVAAERLPKGDESLRYLVAAYPGDESAPPASPFTTRELPPALTLRDRSLAELEASAARSEPRGEAAADGDHPVFLPETALDEARQLAREAGARETGGVLIGHLARDLERGELYCEITAQLPARHAQGELTRLTFGAETWTDVQAALTLRRRGEILLGWWHSHPVAAWCKECAPEKRDACRLRDGFLSAHDKALHRTVFARGFTLALVVSVVDDADPVLSLFGWRAGLLVPRGFRITGASGAGAIALTGGIAHALSA